MASKECPTCCEDYDNNVRRIRILHCGHEQCTSCMGAQLSNNSITCSTCRVVHTYDNVNSIAICYVAEKMIEEMEKLNIKESVSEDKIVDPHTPKLHKGVCTEHGQFNLFWCNTHTEWICPHCCIMDHPRGECDIIQIRKKMEMSKETIKSKGSDEIINLENIEREVKVLMDEFKNKREMEKDQIQNMNMEIDEHEAAIVKLKTSISSREKEVIVLDYNHSSLDALTQDCQKKKSTLENILKSVCDSSSFDDLDSANQVCEKTVIESETMRKTLESENAREKMEDENWKKDLWIGIGSSLYFQKLHEMLHILNRETCVETKDLMMDEAKKVIIQLLNMGEVYAKKVINNNIAMFSQLEYATPMIRVNEFKSSITPSASSIILEFEDIRTLISGAFLHLEHRGSTVADLNITFSPDNPKVVDHMILLCSGSNGSDRWRGSGFNGGVGYQGSPGEVVVCNYYCSDEEGGKSRSPLHQLEEGGSVPETEGVVVGYPGQDPGFAICTRTQANATWHGPLLGHLTATGLRELQTAATKGGKFMAEAVFSKCGVNIDATSTVTA